MKEILSKIFPSDFDNWSSSLSKNLNQFLSDDLVIQHSEIVGGFAPIKGEPNWMHQIALQQKLAFPAFEEKMLFKISDFNQLEKNTDFGVEILAPKKDAEVVLPKILLIPGLGFSLNGERLGRGKGFYDCYLESYLGIKIGLCFEVQLSSHIPVESHDQKMNFIVTEKNIYRI